MSARPIQLFSGAPSVMAADAYRIAVQERRDQWPYVHTYPPPNATDVNVIGTLPVPDPTAGAVVVVQYQVSSGNRFYLQRVVLGANVSIIPGDALFTVDRNSPTGINNTQFMPEHGLLEVPIQLGTFNNNGWSLGRAREFGPLDVVRIKGTNVNLSVGAPAYFVCGLFGYEIPVLDAKLSQ